MHSNIWECEHSDASNGRWPVKNSDKKKIPVIKNQTFWKTPLRNRWMYKLLVVKLVDTKCYVISLNKNLQTFKSYQRTPTVSFDMIASRMNGYGIGQKRLLFLPVSDAL